MTFSKFFHVMTLLVSLLTVTVSWRCAEGRDGFWQGDVSTDWNTAGNWFVVGAPGDGSFVPQSGGGFNVRAIIGTDSPNGALNTTAGNSPVISAALPAAKASVGGLYLGARQLDYTPNPPVFVNPAPAAGALVGQLTISGGTLNNVSTGEANVGADGRIMVGVDGRGFLTMTGGTLTGTGLTVAGENYNNDALGTSRLSLSGSSTLTINGATNLSRRLRIEGPNINFNSQGNVTLSGTNSYTAVITSPTAHSPIKSDVNAFLGGELHLEYSAAAPAIGATWNLFDVAGGIAGNFSNVAADGEVQVAGVPTPQPGEVYRVRQTMSGPRTLLQLVHEAIPVLHVNRDTGELSIRNPFSGAIQLEGYEINSGFGSLLSTYKGISGAPAGDSGWIKAPLNSSTALLEIKQVGAMSLGTTPVSLGTGAGRGFDKFAVDNDVANFGQDGEDLEFFFGTPNGVYRGHVVYEGTKYENDLVLRVNPNTGQAFLKNDSAVTLKLDGYSILSSTGNLNGAGFTGLGSGWQTSSPPTAGAISQTNLLGFTTLAPGAQLPLGDISATGFTTAATQEGLQLQYILAEGFSAGAAGGDYNNDGTVNAADYTVWRDNLGANITLTNVNPAAATPGVVDLEDYDYWKQQFGATGGAMPETTFRTASVVFDTSAGSGGLALGAVPEPGTGLLLISAVGLAASFRRRTKALFSNGEMPIADTEPRGAIAMNGQTTATRFKSVAALFFGLIALAGSTNSALAVTQGISLTNGNFELPGPAGEKVIAFNETGVPFAPTDPLVTLSNNERAGGIPGWTFTGGSGIAASGEINPGVGNSLYGSPTNNLPGDSGTEGGGSPGNELLLSTLDGRVYQSSAFNVVSLPATQRYLLTFDAHNVFSPDGGSTHLSARLYYVDTGGNRQTIGTPLVINELSDLAEYSLSIPGGSPALTPAIGRPLGVEFDTVSKELDPTVTDSWAGLDDVILQITGTTAGDLNGDGNVDTSDYVILRDNLQEAHTYEAQGELTRDYVVDLNDFRAFKTAYDALHGAGSFATMAASVVPEPTSLLTLLVGVGAALARRRRHSTGRRPLPKLAAVAVVVTAIFASARSANAELLVYDPFNIGGANYSVGYLDPVQAPGGGQNPSHLGTDADFFSGGWERRSVVDGTRAAVQSEGLYYLDPSGAQGGSLTLDRTSAPPAGAPATNVDARIGRSLSEPWNNTTEGTYYVSWVVNFGAMLPDNLLGDLGYRALEFWDEPTLPNSGDSDIWVAYSAYNGPPPPRGPAVSRMHVHAPGGNNVIIPSSPASFNDDGATHLVVFKFVFDPDAASDSLFVYLDPISVAEPSIASVSLGGLDLSVGTLGFAMYGSEAQPAITVDELRIATTFSEALPTLPIPGDTDSDGDVDNDDFNNILNNMNNPTPPNTPTLHPDVALGNGVQGSDGKVGLADFWIWKRNEGIFGAGGVASTSVPEPASALLWIMGVIGAMLSAERRPRA